MNVTISPQTAITTAKSPGIGYGALLDVYATSGHQAEVAAARREGLNLFYLYRPQNQLRKGRLDIVRLAKEAHAKANRSGQPWLLINPGDKLPLKFRYSREVEAAVVVAWPDGSVWVRVAIPDGRSTSNQKAFVRATGLNLRVDDRRLAPIRKRQAMAVAITLVAAAFGKPFPPYPPHDSRGRSAHELARGAGGLDVFLQNWK